MIDFFFFFASTAFNAALVIYSAILVQNDPMVNTAVDSLDFRGMDIRRDLLSQAAESLLLLDRGNRMTEKCAKYTYALMHILDSQCKPKSSNSFFFFFGLFPSPVLSHTTHKHSPRPIRPDRGPSQLLECQLPVSAAAEVQPDG